MSNIMVVQFWTTKYMESFEQYQDGQEYNTIRMGKCKRTLLLIGL